MKRVIYTNRLGWQYVTLVRDGDSEDAAKSGLPIGPPDLNNLDWEGAKKEINNLLVARELLTYRDLQRAYTGLASAVAKPIISRLIRIYKNEEHKESNNE